MPQLLRIGSYIIYFWSNENMPIEPIHVHIKEGRPSADATKLWITSTGKAIVSNNNSQIILLLNRRDQRCDMKVLVKILVKKS